MRRNSIWQLIRNDIRSSRRGSRRQGSNRSGNACLRDVADTVLFQPHKSEMLSVWKEMYRTKRLIKRIERGTFQPVSEDTWLGRQKRGLIEAWHEFLDEVKAHLTLLFFHILTLIMIVVCNVLWFAFLFWLMGVWLG